MGRDLRRALPPAQFPPEADLRIRQRMAAAASPERPCTRRFAGRPVRWIASAVAAVLLVIGGAFYENQTKTVRSDLTGLAFADSAEVPSSLGVTQTPVEFRLETALPTLPEEAPVALLSNPKGAANPFFRYQDKEADAHRQGLPPADQSAAEKVAVEWLKKNDHWPSGPVDIVSRVASDQVVTVILGPAKGSPLYTVNEVPSIWVWVANGRVITVQGIWPERAIGAGTVPIKTAVEAWADLQAGKYPWLGIPSDAESFDLPQNPVMSVREVRLEQAMARAADDRQYLIPVVVFQGDVTDTHGQAHTVTAFVSAVRPESSGR